MSQNETAELEWREGAIPVSTRFDDPYFSLQNGLEETRHVFLAGNDLPERLRDGFQVAELGFGTGLNLLALWQCVTELTDQPEISFTSFEAFPLAPADMARAHEVFPELAEPSRALVAEWALGRRRFRLGPVLVDIRIGEATEQLALWKNSVDAWFLDGFSPAKNPELWSPELMAEVGRHTKPGGTFATYTAAGHVRRSLSAAGFSVDRIPGFGRKRHMSVGKKPIDEPE